MAVLTPVTPTVAGVLFGAVAAAGGGDSFPNTGREYFYCKNGGGGGINVTFDSPGTCDFGLAAAAAHDAVIAVGAGEERIIGPFPVTPRFSSTVAVTYSGVTSVTVSVIRPA